MKNSTLIAALVSVTLTIAATVIIGSRLSAQTLALMTGGLIGGVIGLTLGAMIGWYVKSQRTPERWNAPYTPQPTVIVAPPQQGSQAANPGWHTSYAVVPNPQPNNPRQFTIGGEEIVYHESDATW